jgi:hypothetical protein
VLFRIALFLAEEGKEALTRLISLTSEGMDLISPWREAWKKGLTKAPFSVWKKEESAASASVSSSA